MCYLMHNGARSTLEPSWFVFLCHDEAEGSDYVTVFYILCVLHRGAEINKTFDPEMKFC